MARSLATVLIFVVATLTLPPTGASAASSTTSNVSYHRFITAGAPVTMAAGATAVTWISPVFAPGFAFTELVASWNADTTAGSPPAWSDCGPTRRRASSGSSRFAIAANGSGR